MKHQHAMGSTLSIPEKKSEDMSRLESDDIEGGERSSSTPGSGEASNIISLPYQPALDAFTQVEILNMRKADPWKPIDAWSNEGGKHYPFVCGEGLTEYSWISRRVVQKLSKDLKDTSDICAPPETLGKVGFESKGLVTIECHPHHCSELVTIDFNITDHDDSPDFLIGRDRISKVEKIRDK